MRLYRVDSGVDAGIPLSALDGDRLCIEVGNTKFPIEKALGDRLVAAKRDVVQKVREFLGRQALSKEEVRELEYIDEAITVEQPTLLYADLSQDQSQIVREQRRDKDALVLVETGAGENGQLNYRSSTYDEYEDPLSRRVCRRYRDTFPPVGVRVIAEGKHRTGEKSYLLRMSPRASFRMERDGELAGEPSLLTVVWTGRRDRHDQPALLVLTPRHYQR